MKETNNTLFLVKLNKYKKRVDLNITYLVLFLILLLNSSISAHSLVNKKFVKNKIKENSVYNDLLFKNKTEITWIQPNELNTITKFINSTSLITNQTKSLLIETLNVNTTYKDDVDATYRTFSSNAPTTQLYHNVAYKSPLIKQSLLSRKNRSKDLSTLSVNYTTHKSLNPLTTANIPKRKFNIKTNLTLHENEEYPYMLEPILKNKKIIVETKNKKLLNKYDTIGVDQNKTNIKIKTYNTTDIYSNLTDVEKENILEKLENSKREVLIEINWEKVVLEDLMEKYIEARGIVFSLQRLLHKLYFATKSIEKTVFSEKENILIKYELEKYFNDLLNGVYHSRLDKSIFNYLGSINETEFYLLGRKIQKSLNESPLILMDLA